MLSLYCHLVCLQQQRDCYMGSGAICTLPKPWLYLTSILSHFLQEYAHLFKLLYLLFAIGVATITHWQDYFCCLLLVKLVTKVIMMLDIF